MSPVLPVAAAAGYKEGYRIKGSFVKQLQGWRCCCEVMLAVCANNGEVVAEGLVVKGVTSFATSCPHPSLEP